jgi:hypothetical protein
VVAAGATVTAVPLVTVPRALSMLPVPLANVGVNVAEPPTVIVVGLATKLLIVGAGTIVTVAVDVTAVPAAFVTVNV